MTAMTSSVIQMKAQQRPSYIEQQIFCSSQQPTGTAPSHSNLLHPMRTLGLVLPNSPASH
eukprot:1137809-Pelagomonas_calceolata.AAC.6